MNYFIGIKTFRSDGMCILLLWNRRRDKICLIDKQIPCVHVQLDISPVANGKDRVWFVTTAELDVISSVIAIGNLVKVTVVDIAANKECRSCERSARACALSHVCHGEKHLLISPDFLFIPPSKVFFKPNNR